MQICGGKIRVLTDALHDTNSRTMRLLLLLTLLLIVPVQSVTQQPVNPYAPDRAEAGSVEEIRKYTTEARFSSPWVEYVPASETVPSPTKFLGHIVGAPGELSNTTKVYGYMRELDRASERVSVTTIGRSEEGRDNILVA